jgi:hypothetical protein
LKETDPHPLLHDHAQGITRLVVMPTLLQ